MLHIIQNDPEVPPGTIADYLEANGIFYSIHHPYLAEPLPDLRDVSGLIVLGGAMGANDDARHPFLRELKLFIRELVRRGIPYLGVCLGGQLLAAALGAPVVSGRWEELGTMGVRLNGDGAADRLFTGVEEEFVTFQWHHDSFDLPDGAVLLAVSAGCPHQAFRIGDCAWGTQFHPEVNERIIADWCAWDPQTARRAGELVTGFSAAGDRYLAVSRLLLGNFISVWRDRAAGTGHPAEGL